MTIKRKWYFSTFTATCCFISASMAHTTDLWHVYLSATKNDPTFNQQKAALQKNKQLTTSARSELLPQLLINAEYAHTYQSTRVSGNSNYNSSLYTISLTQDLFNIAAFNQLRAAKISVKSAITRFSSQQQDLIFRVSQAYINTLKARDLLLYTKSQLKFAQQFYAMTRKKHKVRFATITEVDQAKQQLNSLRAEEISSQINYDKQIQALTRITAMKYQNFPFFSIKTPILKPSPDKLSAWVNSAKANNLDLKTAKLTVTASHHALSRTHSLFLPSATFFGNYSDSNQLSQINSTNNIKASEIGIRASWPLFEGGKTIAASRTASAELSENIAKMKKVFLDTITNTKDAFIGVSYGQRRIKYSRLAVIDGLNGLRHTQAGFKAGVQTFFDLLQAQNRLFSSEKSYIENFYQYIIDTLSLKKMTGRLTPTDIQQLNHFLVNSAKRSITLISIRTRTHYK